MPPTSTTVDELRSAVGDPTSAQVTDPQLTSMLERALRRYNKFAPREATAVLTLVAGQSLYDPPAGVESVRRVHYDPEVVPDDNRPGAQSPGGLDALAGFNVEDNWPTVLDQRAGASRSSELWGGDVYMEAGKIVFAPAPDCARGVMLVYPTAWAWGDSDGGIEGTGLAAQAAFDDMMMYAEYLGWTKVASLSSAGAGGVKSVTRLGHQTVFADGKNAETNASDVLDRWNSRVERPRVGAIK